MGKRKPIIHLKRDYRDQDGRQWEVYDSMLWCSRCGRNTYNGFRCIDPERDESDVYRCYSCVR